MIEIKSRDGTLIYSNWCATVSEAVAAAIKAGANLRGANLIGANLIYANLIYADLRGANLSYANLRGANLRGADMRGANLSYADLSYADLSRADLRGADLRGADVPVIANIDAQIRDAIRAGGVLNMSDWHNCETTHCRAGWAIHLCGAAGYALQQKVGASAAGALIYAKSRPDKPVPDFSATNDDAMADIETCAAEQVAAS